MLRRAAILLVVLLALAQAGAGEKAGAAAGIGEKADAGAGKMASMQEKAPDEMVDVIIVLKDQPAFGIAEKAREKNEKEQSARKEVKKLILTKNEGQIKEKAKELFAEREKTNKEIEQETEKAVLAGQAELIRYIEAQGGQVKGSITTLNAIHARVPARLAKELEKREDVAQVSEAKNNFRLHLDNSVPTINASAWWNAGYNGSGSVRVAVIDTGVNTSHSWLNVTGRVFEEKSFVAGVQDPGDGLGHGSHVAGIVASAHQTYKGVAYGLSTLVNARIFDSGGHTSGDAYVTAALEWSAGNRSAQVLSNSWGTSYKVWPSCAPTGAIPDGESAFVRFLDSVVEEYQVAEVFSAGNDGDCGNVSLSEEASAYNTIVVGAVDDKNTLNRADDTIASFSSKGRTYDGRKKPDITAPGVNIQSVNYLNNASPLSLSGTSMAAPHVSGAAALLSKYGLSALEVKALLINSAEDKGTPGWDNAYGWGYLDLGKAFAYRNSTYQGNVSDQGSRYYRGTIASKATITWNRHSIYQVNDLDLYLYSAGNGSLLDKSEAIKDNVEQVVGSGQVVLKVHGYNVSNIAAERYALAADGGLQPWEIGAYYYTTNNITVYDNSTFNISARIGILKNSTLNQTNITILPNSLVENYTRHTGNITTNASLEINVTALEITLTPKNTGTGVVVTRLDAATPAISLIAETNITILDDDTEAPNITANRTSGNIMAGDYLLAVNASDASGWRLDVEYKYGNGSAYLLNTSQTNATANAELNYTINESEWRNYTRQTLWWRYRTADLDADRANDSSATSWTGWAAAGMLENMPPSTPAQEYPIGLGLIGDAYFSWAGSTDAEGQNITYEIEIENQTANTTARNYTTSLGYGAHAWKLRAWDGYNYSNYTDLANFSLVLIEANLSIANDSQLYYIENIGLNATLTAGYGDTQNCRAEINSSVLNGTNSTRVIGALAENNTTSLNWTLDGIVGNGNISLLLTCNNQTIETKTANVTIGELMPPTLSGLIYNGTIEAGESQTLMVNATDNYRVGSVWVETAAGNVITSGANGTYFAVWTPPLGAWNFTVWANDTFGNKANATGSFKVTDTRKPMISVEISPVVAARGQNVSIRILASDYRIDAIWANVSYGNTSGLLFGENITFSNTTEAGGYSITAYANDTSGNTANASAGFTVTEPVRVMLQMSAGAMEINANESRISYANESGNITLGAWTYDFTYRRNGTYRIKLNGLNLTENTTVSTQAEEIPANQTPGITNALLLNRTIAFKPNITANGTGFELNATVCINQTGLNYTSGYLRIYKCEWDFANGTCTGAWQEQATYIDGMACTNVTSFSAFALAENQEYCGNGIAEAGETCNTCPLDVTTGCSSGGGSTGGGGGGGVFIPSKNKTQANNETKANKTEIKPAAEIEPEPAVETIEEKIDRLEKETALKKQGNYNTSSIELMLGLAKEQYAKGNFALAGSLLSDAEAKLLNATKMVEEKKEEPIQEVRAAVAAVPADKNPVFYVLIALLAWAIAMIALMQRINPQSQDQAPL